MARNFTIAELLTKGRRACNQVNSSALSDAEWQDELSTIYSDFQAAIIDGGAREFESSGTISTDGSQDYALPADFMTEIGVDYEAGSNGERQELKPFSVHDRNRTSGQAGRARYYAIIGGNVRLYPTPPSGETYYLIYVPQATDISESATSTNIDVIVPAGEKFFKYSLAAIGAAKEGDMERLDYFEAKAADAKRKLIEWSFKRSLTQPRRKYVAGEPGDPYDYEEGDWEYPA